MKRKTKNGFTLVELLAVIVILAIILVIAVPKVMSVIEDAKKATLESTVKMIASAAEKAQVQNTVLGKTDRITCESVAKINNVDYENCTITFQNNVAFVTINGKGKFEGLNICNGTKTSASSTEESCTSIIVTGASYLKTLLAQESTLHNGLQEIIIDPSTSTSTSTSMQNITEPFNAGIRYVGANPNNKVYFNCAETDGTNAYGSENYNYTSSCEIWRIIGVFDTKPSETEDAVPRVKIVRDAVLDTNMSWDTTADGVYSINQWGETTLASDDTTPYNGASLKQYLNGDYYNSLTSVAKGQIGNALWYTGAVGIDTASGVYVNERSDATGTGTTVNYTTKWTGLIGLIYASDFGYAGTNCGNKKILNYAESCGLTSNWLTPSSGSYWTISPNALDSNYVWYVNPWGNADHGGRGFDDQFGVRPALYLSSNVQIIGGDGSIVPYKLK